MNRARAKELLHVIEAFANGEDIQFRLNSPKAVTWLNLPEEEGLILTFPADDFEYRIRPIPREFWVSVQDDGRPVAVGGEQFCVPKVNTLVKVREVLE